jgi:hypothetical protein
MTIVKSCMKVEYVGIVFVTFQGNSYGHYGRVVGTIQTY